MGRFGARAASRRRRFATCQQQRPPQSDLASAPAAKIDPADGSLERMVKYVPAEIIAFQQELVVERPRLVDVLAG
jgi:hypothetical protein